MSLVEVDVSSKDYLYPILNNIDHILLEFNSNKGSMNSNRPKGSTGYRLYELFAEDGQTQNYNLMPFFTSLLTTVPPDIFLSKVGISEVFANIKETLLHREPYDTKNGWHRFHIPLQISGNYVTYLIAGKTYYWQKGKVYDFITPFKEHGTSSNGKGTEIDNRIIIILDIFNKGEPEKAVKDYVYNISKYIRSALLEK
jgi:hypothetical protein